MHDDVAGYALDALDELEQKRFERHLRVCHACRADLPSLQDAAVALAFAAPPVLAPAGLQRPAPRRRRLLVPALAAAAAALAAVFAPVWLIAKATFVAHDRGWVMV